MSPEISRIVVAVHFLHFPRHFLPMVSVNCFHIARMTWYSLRRNQTVAWTAADFGTDAFFAYISVYICRSVHTLPIFSPVNPCALAGVLSAIKNIWISKGVTRVSMCHRLYLNLPTIIIHGSIAHSTHTRIRTITSERFVFVWVENARLACHIINTRSECNVVISPLFTSVDQFFWRIQVCLFF